MALDATTAVQRSTFFRRVYFLFVDNLFESHPKDEDPPPIELDMLDMKGNRVCLWHESGPMASCST